MSFLWHDLAVASSDGEPGPEGRHRREGRRPYKWGRGSSLRVWMLGLLLTLISVGHGVSRVRDCQNACVQSFSVGLIFILGPFVLAATVVVAIQRRK